MASSSKSLSSTYPSNASRSAALAKAEQESIEMLKYKSDEEIVITLCAQHDVCQTRGSEFAKLNDPDLLFGSPVSNEDLKKQCISITGLRMAIRELSITMRFCHETRKSAAKPDLMAILEKAKQTVNHWLNKLDRAEALEEEMLKKNEKKTNVPLPPQDILDSFLASQSMRTELGFQSLLIKRISRKTVRKLRANKQVGPQNPIIKIRGKWYQMSDSKAKEDGGKISDCVVGYGDGEVVLDAQMVRIS